ncbi:hypothetical protein DMENIID0001_117600 [Sergentomyia squamirostris]
MSLQPANASALSCEEPDSSFDVDLFVKMATYAFENQGIRIGRFDSFWKDFLRVNPEFSFYDASDLRLFFVCKVIPSPCDKNIFNIPEEVFAYLKFGDYDPDSESDDEDETEHGVPVCRPNDHQWSVDQELHQIRNSPTRAQRFQDFIREQIAAIHEIVDSDSDTVPYDH